MDTCVDQASVMSALGLNEAWEVLLCLPKIHVDARGAFTSLQRAHKDRPCLVKGFLNAIKAFNRDGEVTHSPYPASIQLDLTVGNDRITTRIFGAKLDELRDLVETTIVLEAQVQFKFGNFSLKSVSLSEVTGKVRPVYTGVPGKIAGEYVEAAIKQAIDDDHWAIAAKAVEAVPSVMEAINRAGRSAMWLLRSLHEPQSLQQADEALALARQATVFQVRSQAQPTRPAEPSTYCIDDALIEMVKAQPETLSESQRKALNTIRKACNAVTPAHILLNGDVGSGKTLVFLLALAAITKASNGTVGVMVPSDLVARQIHSQSKNRFPELRPALILGDSSACSSDEEIAQAKMVIGTQAMLNRSLAPLAALVIDEQHKMSVDQRTALLSPNTHVIEASATPIPRSLALALFDGWVNAVIEHTPVAKTIRNHLLDGDARALANQLIRKHLQAGRKVIFLYPTVNGKETGVKAKGEALEKHFEGKVAILHGKLSAADKIKALDAFRSGERPIVVASTAIEVGVDVPDVGLMVVTGADRFGAAQLHQLRGRLVRNGGEGDFVMLLPQKVTKATRQRLEAVSKNNNGFVLAQKDLELRGFGELLGEMQTGSASTLFKLARLEPEDFLPKRQDRNSAFQPSMI